MDEKEEEGEGEGCEEERRRVMTGRVMTCRTNLRHFRQEGGRDVEDELVSVVLASKGEGLVHLPDIVDEILEVGVT